MTETELMRTSWTCDRCEVTVRWASGEGRADLPANWAQDETGTYCLGCRRELAGDAAIDDPEAGTLETRRKLRSTARIEFELQHNPDAVDGHIAKAAKSSIPAVRKVRERLGIPRAG